MNTYFLKNKQGAHIKITDYGATIMEVSIPQKDLGFRDVVLGFDTPEDYTNAHPYFGALVGRYANRIENGRFLLEGKQYQLIQNNGPNHLHGGAIGFDKKIWEIESVDSNQIVLKHHSPDGEEGYPGALDTKVTYTLTDDNELVIDYRAEVFDLATVVNITNHCYFNLDGAGNGSILDHTLQINANFIIPVDINMIPAKDMMSVSGTPFDFNEPAKISARINAHHKQLRLADGFDHNYVVKDYSGKLQQVATMSSSDNQVSMNVLTTEPGVQLYTGNQLDISGKKDKRYSIRAGLCLETQHFPNSPNRPDYPSTKLHPGEIYKSQTIYQFF